MGHAALNGHAQTRDFGEAHGVVLARADRLREVEVDLAGIDVERRGELDVPDVVAAQPRAHEAGHEPVLGGVSVILDALDQRRRAVSDPDDGNPN